MTLDEKDGIKTITKSRGLTHEQVMTLYTIFSCRSSSNLRIDGFISRFLRVIAGDKAMVVEVNTSDKKQEKMILNDFVLSAVCETDTDTPYIKYFQVYSPEVDANVKSENEPLTLNIIGTRAGFGANLQLICIRTRLRAFSVHRRLSRFM